MNNCRIPNVAAFLLIFLLSLSALAAAYEVKGDEAIKFTLKKEDSQFPQEDPGSQKQGRMELGLRFYGGGGFLFGTNHVNDSYAGTNEFYDDVEVYANDYLWGYSVESIGSLDPLKFAFLGGMELFFNINPYLGFGLGVGYIMGNKKSGPVGLDGYYYDWIYKENTSLTQKVSAIPINLTVYGGLPLGNMIRIVPYVGFGLYLGRITLEDSYYYEDEFWSWTEEGSSSWTDKSSTAFGIHGGMNFDIYFNRNIGFFIGVGGLSAAFVDLVGDKEWEYEGIDFWGNFEGQGTEKDQKLWFYEEVWSLPNPKWYQTADLTGENPNGGSGVRNVEPGKISVSQFRFMVGIVVFFMR